jgi:hypothetical protein
MMHNDFDIEDKYDLSMMVKLSSIGDIYDLSSELIEVANQRLQHVIFNRDSTQT